LFVNDKNEVAKYGEVTDVLNYEIAEVVDESQNIKEIVIICGRIVVY